MTKKARLITIICVAIVVVVLSVVLPVSIVKTRENEYNRILKETLNFTVIDEESKTVSVGPKSVELVNQNFSNQILNIPEKVTLNNGKTYTVTEIEKANFENSVYTSGGFYNCNQLCGVVIPKTVTKIGFFSFYGCTELKTVKIKTGLIPRLEAGTFRLCRNLKTVEIADGVKSISNGVFDNCVSIEKFVVPDSVTLIGSRAFDYCKSLTSVVLPSGLLTLGEKAFIGCDNLSKIYYKGSKEQWDNMKKYSNPEVDNAEIIFDYKG